MRPPIRAEENRTGAKECQGGRPAEVGESPGPSRAQALPGHALPRRLRLPVSRLSSLVQNSIQITPLRMSRIAVNRCHRLPTTAQPLPKLLIWIKKSPTRDSNCGQSLPPCRCRTRRPTMLAKLPARGGPLVATHNRNKPRYSGHAKALGGHDAWGTYHRCHQAFGYEVLAI
jgi:hypothetical protein